MCRPRSGRDDGYHCHAHSKSGTLVLPYFLAQHGSYHSAHGGQKPPFLTMNATSFSDSFIDMHVDVAAVCRLRQMTVRPLLTIGKRSSVKASDAASPMGVIVA